MRPLTQMKAKETIGKIAHAYVFQHNNKLNVLWYKAGRYRIGRADEKDRKLHLLTESVDWQGKFQSGLPRLRLKKFPIRCHQSHFSFLTHLQSRPATPQKRNLNSQTTQPLKRFKMP